MMNKIIYVWALGICMALFMLTGTSCSRSYPCPGTGQMSAADLSKFDEEGEPKSGKRKKKKKDNGLINKKEPKRIHKRGGY